MVKFVDLWRGHPINESVTTPCIAPHDLTNLEGEHVPLGFPVFHNQCAIRMGVALRRTGVQERQLGGCSTCSVHPSSDMHFINASQLANSLAHASIPASGRSRRSPAPSPRTTTRSCSGAPASSTSRTAGNARRTASGRQVDHIDVWNGYRSSAKWLLEWFSWLGYYSNYANAGEIWFWEVK